MAIGLPRIKVFVRLWDKLRRFFDTIVFCHKTVPVWDRRFLGVLSDAVRLCRAGKYEPREAFELGLLKPDLPSCELAKYVSRKKLTKAQESVNPVSWEPVLKNKGIFYRYCMTMGIAVPKLYAIFFKKTAGWSYDASPLISRGNWERFFDRLPQEFVVKPCRGAEGRKFNIFRRRDKTGFVDAFDKFYTPGQLYEVMAADKEHDSFVLQERLFNLPEIVRLSGTDFLQTVRCITFVDINNKCHIMLAYFKPIIGGNIIDNYQCGLTGNLEARVSLESGLLEPAKQVKNDGSGLVDVFTHPKTGISFEGFRLPLWEQTCRLVKETAPKFLPVRTIGWDVAITPDGPRIVEGNIWWDQANEYPCMDVILNTMSSAAKKNG